MGMSHCKNLVTGAALHEGAAWQRRARALHGLQELPDGMVQRHDLHQPHKLLRLVVHQGHAHQRVLVALVHAAAQHICSRRHAARCAQRRPYRGIRVDVGQRRQLQGQYNSHWSYAWASTCDSLQAAHKKLQCLHCRWQHEVICQQAQEQSHGGVELPICFRALAIAVQVHRRRAEQCAAERLKTGIPLAELPKSCTQVSIPLDALLLDAVT
jgi:hypothetical protein